MGGAGPLLGLAALLALAAPVCDAGASAYTLLGQLRAELDGGGAIVEVGSDRGEGSTAFLSSLANATGRQFFSVDFSREGFENARRACGECAQQGMGEEWLVDSFPALSGSGQIVLAYLDNYDWTYPWTKEMQYKRQQRADYEAQGLELGNAMSQEVHLRQATAVARHCSERCFILFDDTWPSARPDVHSGKGGKALAFLLANGFEVVQQVSVWGALDGEHTLVVFSQGVEVLRYVDWASIPGECDEARGSGGGGSCSERRTVPLVLAGGEAEARDTEVVVQVVDSLHRPVASAASSWRADEAPVHGEEGRLGA